MMSLELHLPKEIINVIESRKKRVHSDQDQRLIGQGGFLSDDPVILYDALVALALGKNVLLKGPTGAGKTKLAETLSSFFLSRCTALTVQLILMPKHCLDIKRLSIPAIKQPLSLSKDLLFRR